MRTRNELDDLLKLPPEVLADLYAKASTPKLDDVQGDLRGRMLAWQDVRGIGGDILRALASRSRFPWRGKSFYPKGEASGEGINRVLLDRFKLFRFETSIARSRAGDFDALQLNYDLDGNPTPIRWIKDEMRELAPGLWLGQAYLVLPKRDPKLVLYFGLARA
jgi:hypothetical protein